MRNGAAKRKPDEHADSSAERFVGWTVDHPQESAGKAMGNDEAVVGNKEYVLMKVPRLKQNEAALFKELMNEFKERAKESSAEGESEPAESDVRGRLLEILEEICEEGGLLLGRDSVERILSIAEKNTAGYGVFDVFLKDDDIEEISVIGTNLPIYVFHRSHGWLKTNARITDKAFATNVINKMARPLGRRITYQYPRLNATLLDGSRLHASIAPLTLNDVEMTIRKFRSNPFTIGDIIANETLSAQAAAFLWLALYADVSLLIAGNTGSGKTTTLNALFSFVPETDRVIVTEETPEINIPHPHAVRIVANEELGIGMKEIVRDTLRMRPDRVIIGEVRSKEEVDALFDSLLAGQARGSYATFHGNSAQEAISRLTSLGARNEDLPAINLLLIQRRIPVYDARSRKAGEVRRVTEIVETFRTTGGCGVRALFERDDKGKLVARELEKSAVLDRLTVNYGSSKKELLKELAKREKFLSEISKKRLGFREFTKGVQCFVFGTG
jgi:Flp pilus assembly CpaF family ATPase